MKAAIQPQEMMLLPWLIEPCCLFPFTPGILANFKVQHIVFVITQLKAALQQKHTEKLQVETICRACQESGSPPQRDDAVALSKPERDTGMPRDEKDLCDEAQMHFFWSSKHVKI